jgi:hypothetical protein
LNARKKKRVRTARYMRTIGRANEISEYAKSTLATRCAGKHASVER